MLKYGLVAALAIIFFTFVPFANASVGVAYFYSDNCLMCEEIEPFIQQLQNMSFVELEKFKVSFMPLNPIANDSLFKNLSYLYDSPHDVPIFFVANEWFYFGNRSSVEEEKEKLLQTLHELSNYSIPPPVVDGKIVYPKPVCILIFYNSSRGEDVSDVEDLLEKEIKFVRVDKLDVAAKINRSVMKKVGVNYTPVAIIGEEHYNLSFYNASFIVERAKKYEKIGVDFPPTYEERKICALLFYSPTCPSCIEFKRELDALAKLYPLEIKTYDTHVKENYDLLLDYYAKYNITKPHSSNLFIGDKYFYSITQMDEIEKEVKRWVGIGLDCPTAGKTTPEEFLKKYTVFAVAFLGLVDGINPCAFATLIFFIAYLERVKRREAVLPIGLSFSLAVYMCYFLIGIGLLELLYVVESISSTLGRYIYGTIGVAAIILGIFSFYDFILIKRGETKAILQLPTFLKRKRGRVLKKLTEDRKLLLLSLFAFGAGFVISTIELACTGQILFVFLAAMKSANPPKALVIKYLLIYDFMFIVPLLIILSLFYIGYSSKMLADRHKKTYGYTKLVIGAVLLVMGIYMVHRVFI